MAAMSDETAGYQWRVSDVFTSEGGKYRWKVESTHEGGTAVLRSCSTSWATTRRLTFNEWREGGRWQLESPLPSPPRATEGADAP